MMTFTQMTPPFISTLALPESAGTLSAWPPTGRQIADKPAGGFLRCPTDFLTLPWGLYRAGRLPFLALRTWYGVLELPERRCVCTEDQDVHYSLDELCQLLRVPRRAPVQAALRSLEELGLVAWSASAIRYLPEPAVLRERVLPGYQALQAQIPAWRTWVPVPRRLVRWLAREGTPGLCATAVGVLLRCLWSKQRQCVSGGRVAASWIAKGFGVAERTVQRALDGLQTCGWLARLPSTNAADAVYERRYGARTVINLAWNAPDALEPDHAEKVPAPKGAGREKSRPACQEVFVKHFVKHFVTLDQNLSPIPPPFDQNLSLTSPATLPANPRKSRSCETPSGIDLYPLQEQRPDPLPLVRGYAPDVQTGVYHSTPDENKHPNAQAAEKPMVTPLPTPPAPANPVLLEDSAAAFAALPSAVQDELLQAATARLLARGLPVALLIRPALLAEVYAQMVPPSLATAPGEARRVVPVSAAPRQESSVQAAPARLVPLVDPAAAFAALPLAEQDAMLAAVTARLLAQGMRKALLIRPLLLAEVYAQLAPPPSPQATPSSARREAPTSARPPRAVAPPDLYDVVPADLRDVARLEALRQQAIRRGWLTGCDADRLNFVAAAVHARRIGSAPCALFVALVRGKRWELITQEDEDQALALLRQGAEGGKRPSVAAPLAPLSDDARLVRVVQQTLRQTDWRGDPLVLVRQHDPTWTRARWDAARAELYGLSRRPGLERLGEVLEDEDCGGWL